MLRDTKIKTDEEISQHAFVNTDATYTRDKT